MDFLEKHKTQYYMPFWVVLTKCMGRNENSIGYQVGEKLLMFAFHLHDNIFMTAQVVIGGNRKVM